MNPKNKRLSLSLVLLLLFTNSGLASSLMDHGHSLVSPDAMDMQYMSRNAPATHSHNHTLAEAEQEHSAAPAVSSDHTASDCLCDGLCSISSLHVLNADAITKTVPSKLNSHFSARFYQSILLNLPVPPPTQ